MGFNTAYTENLLKFIILNQNIENLILNQNS